MSVIMGSHYVVAEENLGIRAEMSHILLINITYAKKKLYQHHTFVTLLAILFLLAINWGKIKIGNTDPTNNLSSMDRQRVFTAIKGEIRTI